MASPSPNSLIPRRSRRRTRPLRRSAAVTLEAILAIPLLVIALFATFQFAMILTVRHAVQYAAIEAAREASKITTNNADRLSTAITVAGDVLAVHGLDVCAGADEVQVISEDPDDIGNQVLECGPSIVTPTPALSAATGTVRIHLAVYLSSVPIPNLLDYFGFDLAGEYLHVKSDAVKENS